MPAPIGNEYASACKGRENKKKAWEAYCLHVSKGYLKESFFWKSKDGKARATHRIITYIYRNQPEVCSALLMEESQAKNLRFWEQLGMDIATGKNPKAEGWVWASNMFNRFKGELGWRLTDKNVDDEATTAATQEKIDKVAGLASDINGNGNGKD